MLLLPMDNIEEDRKWMELALEEAKKAFSLGEVPVGAVLVVDQKVIAKAHNLVESLQDPSAHAELLVLRRAAGVLGNWRLLGATLYCTLEPCLMCAGGMIQGRVKRLVWGAPDLRQGAHGSLINVLDHPHPIHQLEVASGVLSGECGQLMRQFFRSVREKKKIFESLIEGQKKQLERSAHEILPHVTEEDLLQPNDFPQLEGNPYFRYEEGVLHGMMSAQATYLVEHAEDACT